MKSPKARAAVRLSSAERARLLAVVGEADSVELKLTVPTAKHKATIAGLGIDPLEAEPRQVFFFDTSELQLHGAGVVVRARRVRGGGGNTVIKLRPVVPAELPQALRQSASFKLEVDCVPGGFACSGSLKGKAKGDAIRDVAAGEMPLRKLLSPEQRQFYQDHAPAGVELDALKILGPTFALRTELRPKRLKRKIVVEFWLCPDGSRLLEISTKCEPRETLEVTEQLRDYLARHGITPDTVQQTKSKTILEYYARELRRMSP